MTWVCTIGNGYQHPKGFSGVDFYLCTPFLDVFSLKCCCHSWFNTHKQTTPCCLIKRAVPLINKLSELGLKWHVAIHQIYWFTKVMVISLKLCELEVIQVIEQVWLTSPAEWSTWISPGDRSHGIWSSCESPYEMSSWNNPLTNQWKTGPANLRIIDTLH